MKTRSLPNDQGSSPSGLLKVIAIFKVAKAVLLVAMGFGALQLLRPEVARQAARWASAFAWRLGPHGGPAFQGGLARLQASRLPVVGLVAFFYAALFLAEGVGLWKGRRWAEYLTIVATSSFVPLEVYELFRHVTWPRGLTLVINLLVVTYLIGKVRRERRLEVERSGQRSDAAPGLPSKGLGFR